MAKFRKSSGAAIGSDPLGRVVTYLLPALVFLSVTAISRHFAIGFAAVCLALSLGKAAFGRLRGRVSLLTIAVVLYALLCLASGLWSHFPAYARQESVKFIVGLSLFGLILSRVEKEKLGGLLWGLDGSIAIVSLLCIDAGSCQLLSRVFAALMQLFRTSYNLKTMGYEAGIRITGIYSNANVSAGVIAFGLLLSLYLYKTARCGKGRLAAALTVGVEALAFFLSFSMGAMAAFAVSCLVYVLASGKGERLPLFILMLECVFVTVVCAFAATPFLGSGSVVPVVLAFVCGGVIWALERFVGSRVSAALAEKGKAVAAIGGALVALVAVYVVLAFSVTGGTTLNGVDKLSRAVYPAPGDYTVSVEGAIDPQVRIYTQNEAQLMMHRETILYKGKLSEAAFTVPEDSRVVWFVLVGDGDLDAVTLSDGTELPLGYKLLPAFAANRLQGLKANQNFIQRLVFFEDGIKLWKKSPVIGWGIGGVEGQLTSVQSFYYESKYIHNHFIQILDEVGVVGLTSFLLLLGGAAWLLLKSRKRERDPVAAMLLAGMTMMIVHSLTEVVWSAPVYIPVVFTLFAVVQICCGEEKQNGVIGVAAALALWAVAIVFAVFQLGSILAEVSFSQTENDRNLTPQSFMESLEQMDLLEIYDDSPYRINAMGNAVQMEGGFDKATELAEKLLATEEFDNCYYVASYYCLPVRDFDTFFRAVHAGIRQEASNHEAWNSMTDLCSRAVRQLDAEELEAFLPGVAGLRAELEAFNGSGRMEQIVMEEENQRFLDTAAMLAQTKADGQTAQALLDALNK